MKQSPEPAADMPEAAAYLGALALASLSLDVLTERSSWVLMGGYRLASQPVTRTPA